MTDNNLSIQFHYTLDISKNIYEQSKSKGMH